MIIRALTKCPKSRDPLKVEPFYDNRGAGDKTAYLVTDLTVTAVTDMKLNSRFLGQ